MIDDVVFLWGDRAIFKQKLWYHPFTIGNKKVNLLTYAHVYLDEHQAALNANIWYLNFVLLKM